MPRQAWQTRHPTPRPGGFTLVELIAVLLMVGVLAVAVAPRMDGAMGFRTTAWRDQVLAALRHAGALAQGHRRLVCVAVGSNAVTLSMATTNPASSCSVALPGHDGQAAFAHDANAPATTLSPSGTLYFQPNGRVTADGAGSSATDRSIGISGESAITLTAETGHVR